MMDLIYKSFGIYTTEGKIIIIIIKTASCSTVFWVAAIAEMALSINDGFNLCCNWRLLWRSVEQQFRLTRRQTKLTQPIFDNFRSVIYFVISNSICRLISDGSAVLKHYSSDVTNSSEHTSRRNKIKQVKQAADEKNDNNSYIAWYCITVK